MKDYDDDFRRVLIQESSIKDDYHRRETSSSLASPSLVAKTTTVSVYPTIVNSFFACNPQSVYGLEQEGLVGTLTADSTTFYALNLGTSIPPIGTIILATFTANRWVFRYDA